MSKFAPGDDVIVEFDGLEHRGEIKSHSNGWCMARIVIDPLADYGRVTPALGVRSVVCVPESRVRSAAEK